MTEDVEVTESAGFWAVSPRDAVAAGLGVLHFVGVMELVFVAPTLPTAALIGLGCLYALGIAWSNHGIAHNFIHNPFFTSGGLNRLFSLLLSVTLAQSQGLTRYLHLRHHIGNSDRPDANGETKDPLSIYRHGRLGEAEPVLRYCVIGLVRTDLTAALAALTRTNPVDASWLRVELALVVGVAGAALWWDGPAILFLVPFWLLGHALSALTNYYEHLGADPKKPIAWGVSHYGRVYNWLTLNNGHHAEHHFRTKVHWSELPALHRRLAEQQAAAGVRVLSWPHPLGFLEPRDGSGRT